MKYPALLFLLMTMAMSSCETAKDAGFRVNWTFAKRGPAALQPAPPPSPPSPSPAQRVVRTKPIPEPERAQSQAAPAQSKPTPTPAQVAEKIEPPAPSMTPAVSSQVSAIPFAKPVAGKPGYVYSPFNTKGGYIDVTGYKAGSLAKDPYSGKIFRVP
jgi:hypothetical protein